MPAAIGGNQWLMLGTRERVAEVVAEAMGAVAALRRAGEPPRRLKSSRVEAAPRPEIAGSMDQPEIRKASLDDSAALAELSDQLGYPSSVQGIKERLTPILGAGEHLVLVAVLHGVIVGWIHVFLALRVESEPFAELGGLVVGEGFRGRSIGRLLMAAAEAWARSQKVGKLRLRTRSSRHDADTFYERLGYTQTKQQYVYDLDLGLSG